ncbi:unnamed protein product [Durusdinium trenchii]|uniref:peptide-methionine (S)-S-oxide reductase n=1 Tax=Durusdinium trenchii TaxID=1381693 RepID=A0ABP0Q4J6_9DINO
MPMNQRYYLSFLLPSLFLSGCADAALPQACAHPDPSIRSGDTEVKVYFGCGCFWHVQHEFVVDEMTKLCRQDGNITARTAYAGGTHMDNGLVCYHNALGKADYGQLGHSEVVSMSVPVSAFATFAQTFWDICPKGVRRDVQDIGGEYRSVVGLPGGIHSSLMKDLASSATAKLVPGTGNEGDTLGSDTVIVYDSDHFPAHVAEKYHQFHDDMMDHYGGAYHALRGFAARRVADENLIVYAETGSGKTLVAELAIKEALKQQPEKRCAFLVTATRLLAHQQWQRLLDSLREEDPSTLSEDVVEVTGYTTSDWCLEQWRDCMSRSKVLVGTIETLCRAIVDHGYLSLSEFSLVVIDECHKATGDSPGAEILHRIASSSPRVLGLTASYANDKATTAEGFQQSRRTLQALFRGQVHTCDVPQRRKPRFKKIEYIAPQLGAQRLAEEVCHRLWEELRKADVREPKEAQRLVQQMVDLLQELGSEAFLHGLEHGVVAQMEGRIDNFSKILERKSLAQIYQVDLEKLKLALRGVVESVKQMDILRSFDASSPKLCALLRCLEQELGTNETSCGMVFVSKVALALPLAAVLEQKLANVAIGAVSGVNSMTELSRNKAFLDFREGRTRLLVCTQCAEEGLDVAECSFVIRFQEFETTRSHVQGVGRARKEEARVYYFENCPDLECQRAEVMDTVARKAEAVIPVALPPYCRRSDVHPFTVPGSGAEVNFRSAPRILSEYISQTAGGLSFKSLKVDGGVLFAGPTGGLKLLEKDVCRLMAEHIDVDTDTLLKYVSVLALHSQGWLDCHNTVPKRILRQSARWYRSALEAEPIACPELRCLVSRISPSAPAHLSSRERTHVASGAEQVELGRRRLKPDEILNTQLTVNQTFSNGSNVLQAMADIVLGTKDVKDFPCIRVAWSVAGQCWYSADNRRLFIFKVVMPLIDLTDIEVDEINWTSEFDCKNRQAERWGKVWATHEKSVRQVRHKLLELLAGQGDEGDPEFHDEDERSASILRRLPDAAVLMDGVDVRAEGSVGAHHQSELSRRSSLMKASVPGSPCSFPAAHMQSSWKLFLCSGERRPQWDRTGHPQGQLQADVLEEVEDRGRAPELQDAYHLPAAPSRNVAYLEGTTRPSTKAAHAVQPTAFHRVLGEAEPEREPLERMEVIQGGSPEAEELLRRVGLTLSRSCKREDEESAVSLLKEALEGHCRLKDFEELPWTWQDFGDKSFRSVVIVAGKRFVGDEASNKKSAKKKAALAAIRGLCQLVEPAEPSAAEPPAMSSTSEGSEDSWHVVRLEDLDDIEVVTATGHDVPSGYVRLELVFEPTQKFFNPKNELLDHLQGALGRSPSPSELRFAFKGRDGFWRCRAEANMPMLQGSFEGIPAESQRQAEQNAAWRVVEKMKLIQVREMEKTCTVKDILRTLPSENLELLQDGSILSNDLRLSELRGGRLEVREAEPW